MNKHIAVMSAFACDPRLPSEPSIGWHFVNALNEAASAEENCEIIIFMNERSRDITVERWTGSINATLVGVALPRGFRLLLNPKLTRLEYLVWNLQVRKRLKKLANDHVIVLAHHVTFASELLPTPISVLGENTLKVWGPVGSSGNASVYQVKPRQRAWAAHYLVQLLRSSVSKIFASANGKRMDLVLTQSTELRRYLNKPGRSAEVFPNLVIEDELMDWVSESEKNHPFLNKHKKVVVCVGNLVYLKRFELAIASLAMPELLDARLVIIGKPAEGQINHLLPLAKLYGVEDRVEFTGQISRMEVLTYMRTADVVFHPSAREGAPGVVGEATTLGIPVVCFEKTGAEAVLRAAGTSGLVLSPRLSDPESIAIALSDAMKLPKLSTLQWDYRRYVELERKLLRNAVENITNNE